jgi:hypothetical protein
LPKLNVNLRYPEIEEEKESKRENSEKESPRRDLIFWVNLAS